jgi:hypothetical protein
MKHNLLKFSLIFLIFSILTGCIASHVGSMSGSASLDAPNFMYKKQNVFGEAQATYVLGIGGVARQSLIVEAKKNMLKANPLLKNQALANVSVSYKSTGFLGFIVTTVKCDVSADIVEFGPLQTDFSQSQSQNLTSVLSKDNSSTAGIKTENKNTEINTDASIKVGDKVKIINYFSNPVDGKVIEIQNGDYIVEYKKSNNKTKQVKVLGFQVQRIK